MYVGNVGLGLIVMFGYWLLLIVNVLLCFMCIGLVTLPMTWVVAMIVSPISAANAAREQAWREMEHYQ